MNDPKLGAAMNAAAEKDIEDNAMKGLADLSSLKDETRRPPFTQTAPATPRPHPEVPNVPSIAHIFDGSFELRSSEIKNVEERIKELDLTLAEDMLFLKSLVGKININTDQVQALRSHLVRLKLEQAIHSTGVTSNYKSL